MEFDKDKLMDNACYRNQSSGSICHSWLVSLLVSLVESTTATAKTRSTDDPHSPGTYRSGLCETFYIFMLAMKTNE